MTEETTMALDPSELAKVQRDRSQLASAAEALVISDDRTFADAAELVRGIAACRKFGKSLFLKIRASAKKTLADIDAQEKELVNPLDGPDRTIRQKMTDYEVARRKKLDDDRIAAEKKSREDAVDEKINRAIRLEEHAAKTGDAHYAKAAEQVLNAPVVATTPVRREPEKPKGISFRDEIGVEIFDLDLLIAAVASGKVSKSALLANVSWLRTEAKQRGESFDVPGVKRTVERDVTVRA